MQFPLVERRQAVEAAKDTKTAITLVDTCEAVGMIEGNPQSKYFYPGLQFHRGSGGTTSDDERADQLRLAIQLVKEAVDRVYLVNAVDVRGMDPPTKTAKPDTVEERLQSLGFTIRSSRKKDGTKEEDDDNDKKGPQIRFEPFGHEVSFDSDGVRRLVRHAVDGVWSRLSRKYVIRLGDTAQQDKQKLVTSNGIYVQRESSAWDNSALTVSTRDALYVMNAVELARRNAEPLKIGDKVRFLNQASSVWRRGTVVNVVPLVGGPAIREPDDMQFRWSQFWTSSAAGSGGLPVPTFRPPCRTSAAGTACATGCGARPT